MGEVNNFLLLRAPLFQEFASKCKFQEIRGLKLLFSRGQQPLDLEVGIILDF